MRWLRQTFTFLSAFGIALVFVCVLFELPFSTSPSTTCVSPPGQRLDDVCHLNISLLVDRCETGEEVCYISYGIWGDDDYASDITKNIKLARFFYPGWRIRIYTDDSISRKAVAALQTDISEVVVIRNITGKIAGMFWRFFIMFDDKVDRWIVRDADSKLGSRERAAVDEWIASGRGFHVMNDHPAHSYWPIIGCCFGGIRGVVPKEVKHTIVDGMNQTTYKGGDQDWLRDYVYPHVRDNMIAHSSWRCSSQSNFMPFPTRRLGKLDFVGCNSRIDLPEVLDESDSWMKKDRLDEEYINDYQKYMKTFYPQEPHNDGTCPPKCRRHPSWVFC